MYQTTAAAVVVWILFGFPTTMTFWIEYDKSWPVSVGYGVLWPIFLVLFIVKSMWLAAVDFLDFLER